jgi:hypothetical protein
MLLPHLPKDGKVFTHWNKLADELNTNGYQISISSYLEQRASTEQKEKGLNLLTF